MDGGFNNHLSVVVATHDNRSIIGDLLRDLLEQVEPSTEVIVVDDSVDGTAEVVREFLLRHATRQWNLVQLKDRVGASAARNVGWRTSHGRFLLFLDSDVRVTQPHFLALMESFIRSHAEVGVVCPIVRRMDGRIQSAGVPAVLPGLFPYYPFSRLERRAPATPVYTFAPLGAAMLFRREVLDACGGFDETLTPGCYEELDLAWRAALVGYHTAVLSEAFVLHRDHATFGRLSVDRIYYLNKYHQCRSVAKNAPFSALVLALFVVPLVGIADDGLRFARSLDPRFLGVTPRYLASLVGAASTLLRQRRATPRSPGLKQVLRDFGKPVPPDKGGRLYG